MNGFDFPHIMGRVAQRLLGDPNKSLSNGKELRFGNRGSMCINLEAGTFYDHENGVGGGVIDLVCRQQRCDKSQALDWLRQERFLNSHMRKTASAIDVGAKSPEPKPAAATANKKHSAKLYDYVDEGGNLLHQTVRYDPKDFSQRRPGGREGWIWNLDGVRLVLYRLPELIEAVSLGRVVLIVEGEKDVDALHGIGVIATCNPMGANKWRDSYNDALRGADVILVPDADEAGWKHVGAVGQALQGIAASLRLLVLPKAKDVSDWIAAGGTREQLDALIEAAPPWTAPPPPKEDAEKAKATTKEDELLEALARMPKGVRYGKRRKELAAELGVSRGDIDDEVEARRLEREVETAPLHGHWTTDPWPETVDGDALLRDIIARVKKHVIFEEDYVLAAALWVMMAWVHEAVAVHSPILNANSAEPESGKTTLLGVLAYLMPRCIASVEISEAALYRSIERWHPSFCIDEFDSVLADKEKTELRSVINSGHTRGSGVIRCIGDEKIPELFSTFCPKAIGMVGLKLPDATLGRCLVIKMRRKKRTDTVERFMHVDDDGLAQLRSRLARWSADNEDVLRRASPAMASFDNRRADNWRLQFAIADLAGNGWGDKAREAAERIEKASDKDSIGTQLLADIWKIFQEEKDDAILSATLVAKLVEYPEAPWVEWHRGKGLSQNGLARLLKAYGVAPTHLDPPRVAVPGRGYQRHQFEDAWARYLTREAQDTTDNSHKSSVSGS
jgi:hypothetical protein